jgi:hypothetical protein
MKRKLPVIQPKAEQDAAAEKRAPWQWVAIGAGFVVTIWIPLVIAGLWLARALGLSPTLAALGTFMVACFTAGLLVGRFGGQAKEREAALAGALGALVACGVALLGGAATSLLVVFAGLVLGTFGAGVAWLGGRFGVKLRRT